MFRDEWNTNGRCFPYTDDAIAHQQFLKKSLEQNHESEKASRNLILGLLQLNFDISLGIQSGLSLEELGLIAPPHQDTMETFLDELYSPMLDAKCFNDRYDVPSPDKLELYKDYKKIFEWGLLNPPESPLYDFSSEVSNNRFPGMCLRMAFHDNSINGQDHADYVNANIDPATAKWTGPELLMETSGGDASVLVCEPERLHPNQNYDQTASRVLHAFQSTADFPEGPGIGGSGESLMTKYDMSYADALHNCALAAIKFMTEPDGINIDQLELDIKNIEKRRIARVYDKMTFGRKDACYVTDKSPSSFSDDLGANSRRPLCGPTNVLPGVTLDAAGVKNWFDSRGMPVGVWLSLFGTHSALDNFSDPQMIRFFGIPGKDYFEDFVGCPFHKLTAPVTDPEDSGCQWTPVCDDPSNDDEEPWNLVQSDCATSIDLIQESEDEYLEDLELQMQVYIAKPGSWIPDVICALEILGGDHGSCVGPYGISEEKVSFFGSFWRNDYPIPASASPCNYKCPDSCVAMSTCVMSMEDCNCEKKKGVNIFGIRLFGGP